MEELTVTDTNRKQDDQREARDPARISGERDGRNESVGGPGSQSAVQEALAIADIGGQEALCILAAEVRRLQAAAYNKCDVCLGEPLPSGKPCVCEGNGTIWATAVGLRKQIYELQAVLSRLSWGSPPGWKLVPVEPTEEMLDHAWGMVIPTPGYPLEEWAAVYRAMLSASPPPTPEKILGT